MATKKEKAAAADTPLTVRVSGTDEGTVVFSVGHVVPVEEFKEDQTEHEFAEDSSFELTPDEARALADAIPAAAQDASARVLLDDRSGLAEHDADGKVKATDEAGVA
jgi:hypothetical protein